MGGKGGSVAILIHHTCCGEGGSSRWGDLTRSTMEDHTILLTVHLNRMV